MTDNRRQPDPAFGAALIRGMTQRRLSRRDLIKYGGATVGTLSLASILAACGGEPAGAPEPGDGPTVDFNAEPGTEINFANWPLYIDSAKDPDTGDRIHPSLQSFTDETGITVNYNDEIQANASFFGQLLPQLQAGQDTGRDIIVITNGREFTALTLNGWITELDPSLRPNFDANAAKWAKDPDYDPGNKFSMAWQSGLTGVGWNTEKVTQPITKLDDLMNPDIVGTNSVGMITGDMPDVVMVNLGITPTESGPAEWQEAADWIQMLKDSGTLRKFYDQGYVDDFTAGNLAATMAWSGDVLYYKIWEDQPYEFVVPEGGALLWIDNMMIPANSANPQGAYQLMDFVYKPEIAQLITEWVLYMSPVPAVQDLIAQHASEEKGAYAADLEETASSSLLWPDDALLAKTPFGRNLTTDEEREEWDNIFIPITES
ncbi:MAG: spermidine/putrescine ABC transporter substrate-binding protein [Actinomycetota bacterium]